MSWRTDLADDVVWSVVSRFVNETDDDKRAALWRLAQAAVRARRAVYQGEARRSRMRSAYRARHR